MYLQGRSRRAALAILSVLLMVLGSVGVAAGGSPSTHADSESHGVQATLIRDPFTGEKVHLAPAVADHPTSRAPGDGEDQFTLINPWPTGADLYDADFGGDDDHGAIVGSGGTLVLYDSNDFFVIPTGTDVTLTAVAVRPTNGDVLIGGFSGQLYRYRDGEVTSLFSGTGDQITGIDFGPNGNYALLVTNGGRVLEYDADTGTVVLIQRFLGYNWQAVSINQQTQAALLAGYAVAAGGNAFEGRMKIYQGGIFTNVATGLEGTGVDSDLYGADWDDEDNLALAVGMNGRIMEVDGETKTLTRSVQVAAQWLTGVGWNTVDHLFLIGGYFQGDIYAYDPETVGDDNPAVPLVKSTGRLRAVGGAPEGENILVGDDGVIYSCGGFTCTRLSAPNTANLFDVAFRPDGAYALAVGESGTVLKYDGDVLQDITPLPGQIGEDFLAVAFDPLDYNHALISGTGGSLYSFTDLGGGAVQLSPIVSRTGADLWGTAYDDDGDLALIAGSNGQLRKYQGGSADVEANPSVRDLYDVDFRDGQLGYAVGAGGTVVRYNSGAQINAVSLPKPDGLGNRLLTSIDAMSPQSPVPGQDSFHLITSFRQLVEYHDNGDLLQLNDFVSIRDPEVDVTWWDSARFDNDDEHYALIVGENGNVLAYRQAFVEGMPFRVLSAPTTADLYGITWNEDDYALIVGESGTVVKYEPNRPPPPVTLDVPTNVTDSSLKLTWSVSPVSDFLAYDVHMSTSPDFVPDGSNRITRILDRPTVGYAVTGLSKNTVYYFAVRVIDSGSLTSTSNVVWAKTLLGNIPPVAVTLEPITEITQTSLTLDWSQNEDNDFDRYEVHMGSTAGFTLGPASLVDQVQERTTTTYYIGSLAAGTTRYFRIRTVDGGGLFNDSNERGATTATVNVAPDPVTFAFESATDHGLTLNWTTSAVSDFASYEVFLGSVSASVPSNGTRIATITDRDTHIGSVSNLDDNTTYYGVVRVVDTGGLSADSPKLSATTLPLNPPPLAVTLSTPANVTEATMDLHWTMSPDSDFSNYTLHMATHAAFTPNASTRLNVISSAQDVDYHVSGLDVNTTYYFTVEVRDTGGLSTLSNYVNAKTLPNALPTPTTVSVISVSSDSITIKWNASEAGDFDHYEVHASLNESFSPDPTTKVDEIASVSSTLFEVTHLEPSTTYYLLVRIVDEVSQFADSNVVAGTTAGPDLPPKAVSLAEPTNVTDVSLQLDWTTSTAQDFASYDVLRALSPSFAENDSMLRGSVTNPNTTTFIDTGLTAEKTYYYKVRVKDQGGNGNLSNEVFATTLPPNELPTVNVGPDLAVAVGDPVTLSGSAVDPDGEIVHYAWDADNDGSVDFSSNTSGTFVTHYATEGVYIAVFSAIDDRGGVGSGEVTVTVSPPEPDVPAPKVDLGEDLTGIVGEEVELTAKVTGGQAPLSWSWDLDGDGQADSSETETAVFTYDEEGTFRVDLEVTDALGQVGHDSLRVKVSPANLRPAAKIAAPHDGDVFEVGSSIRFDATGSTDGNPGDSLSYSWTSSRDSVLGTKKVVIAELSAGRHLITLEVSDGSLVGEASITIEVAQPVNAGPRITVESPVAGETVSGSVLITGRAIDEDGVKDLVVRVGATVLKGVEGKTQWSVVWDASKLSGPKTIVVTATDGRGVESTLEVSVSVLGSGKGDHDKNKGFLGLPGFEGILGIAALGVVLAIRSRRGSLPPRHA